MTVSEAENKTPDTLQQEKADTNMSQTNVDSNMTQNTGEPEKPEDPNWKAFREARKKDRSEREAAEKRALEKEAEAAALRAAMEAAFAKGNTPNLNNRYEEQPEETEDQRIEKKVQAALAQRETQAAQERQSREVEEYPQRLQQHFPDFQQTIANDNLDYLEYHYPEVASPLKRLPDGYDKWHDIYKAIKKFIPNTDSRKDSQKAQNNFNKPRSMSSSGMTQAETGAPAVHIITKEQREANWARMQRALKGLS